MGESSRSSARASRSLDSCRPSRARACHISRTRRLPVTCLSSITSCSRHSSRHRHDNVRPTSPHPKSILTLHQVSPKHFMGNQLEIKTNYRLICRYCIPSSHNIINLWLSDLVLCTTILVLHIGRIPPHNDNYNNNTSTGRTRRTGKRNKEQTSKSYYKKSGKGGSHRMNGQSAQ